jgi:hypothetical protein
MNIFIHGIDYHILYFLPAEDVLNMCQVNKQFAAICNDEFYWETKFKYDYPKYFDIKPVNMTWKQTYLDLAKDVFKPFPVFCAENLLDYIWLRDFNTQKEAWSSIKQVYLNKFTTEPRTSALTFLIILNDNKYHMLNTSDKFLVQNWKRYNENIWRDAIGFEIVNFVSRSYSFSQKSTSITLRDGQILNARY